MQGVRIKYRPGLRGDNEVKIDGVDFSNIAKSVQIRIDSGGVPEVDIELIPSLCEIDATGLVFFNLTSIPEPLARSIYQKLHKKFGGDHG